MVALLGRCARRPGRHQRHRGERQAAGPVLSAPGARTDALLLTLLASTTPTGWKSGALDEARAAIARELTDEPALLELIHQLTQLVALLGQRGEPQAASQLAQALEVSLAARGTSQGVLEVREEQREAAASSRERATEAFKAFTPEAPVAQVSGPVISAAKLLRGSTKG